MRIQHNITAMAAYRNYTNNTSAVAKNLEKLSSGYKINRAGDDAAGLAVSEKMRAQITGLEAAQKNAKDGISLVQTAEGALTEVHDMLNRMYELAELASNGTYDDEVDRANYQKEIDSLSTEINRIADSVNFNGINLLDGSLESGTSVSRTTTLSGMLPGVGETLGTDTVLHKEAGTASTTSFSIDLHNLTFANNDDGNGNNAKLEIKIGNNTFTLEAGDIGTTNTAVKASDIAQAFVNGDFAEITTAGEATIDGIDFTVTASGTRVTFTQKNASDDMSGFDPDMKVSVNGIKAGQTGATGNNIAGTAATNVAAGTGGNGDEGLIDFSNLDKDAILAAIEAVNTANPGTISDGDAITIEKDAGNATTGKLELKVGTTVIGTTAAAPWGAGGFAFTTAGGDALGSVAVTPKTAGDNILVSTFTTAYNSGLTYKAAAGANPGTGDNPVNGDHNVSTTVIVNSATASNERLASTHFELTKDMVVDGGKITIGKESYEFSTKAADKNAAGKVYIGDIKDIDAEMSTIAERLTKAAENNKTYTVGHDGTRMTFTENVGQTEFVDENNLSTLTSLKAIEESFSFSTATVQGKPLTLQIGDTAESFNKLTVSVNDMHTAAMGIGSINISTQDGASDAMAKVKAAINYVSSTRGDLGATQNRLEHTINNLSVMQENIQDAESTIRDVDIAQEMMAYTKNNILVQSAQAMLAQANQLPQGVLQLLQ